MRTCFLLRDGRFACVVTVLAVVIVAMAPAARAQNVNDLMNEMNDLMIQQSLGSFGSSLGSKIPIFVDHKSAYTTVAKLPGKAFAAKAPPSIAGALRSSKDGTVTLPPGDYAFPVDVFCMRANAESPNGYQYRLAPLRGSAADIITALNARAPSYVIGHGVLQVLSWNIQGGVPYAAMAAPERAAVDKLIPEFRSRFKGTANSSTASQYAQLARTIRGMPAFAEAMRRIGPIGNAMSNVTTLQQQLGAHSQEFDQLSRVLVPVGAIAGSAMKPTAASLATPWSHYSDQVFARFRTAGNFATPGTYEVRVLPGPPARVPFTNIVADPKTDTVQPLTIAVRTYAAAPAPILVKRRTPMPPPKITSVTVATVPGTPNSRTAIGVGEHVTLTFSRGNAIWSLDSHSLNPVEKLEEGHLASKLGSATTYIAASDARTETITAEGAGNAKASITFNVIAPTEVKQVVDPMMPLIHTFDEPNVGFWADSYIEPASVSFQYIRVREGDVCPAATGVFVPQHGGILGGHQPNITPSKILYVDAGLGSRVDGHDIDYSGQAASVGFSFPGGHPTYAPGSLRYHIPWYYVVNSGGSEHRFTFVDFVAELEADGNTLTASKAGASVSTTVLSATVGTPPGGGSGSSGPSTPAMPCP